MECGKQSGIGSWIFVQNQFYVRPYSCNGGDYWKNNKTESCDIICPRCGQENYLYNHPKRDAIVKLVSSGVFLKEDMFREVRIKQSN